VPVPAVRAWVGRQAGAAGRAPVQGVDGVGVGVGGVPAVRGVLLGATGGTGRRGAFGRQEGVMVPIGILVAVGLVGLLAGWL